MLNLLCTRLSIILSLVFLAPYAQASHNIDVETIAQQGHHFSTVTAYDAVKAKVDELLAQGVKAEDIAVLTDWDGVVNTPGAWEQKYHSGEFVCPKTKRMTLEHEVDEDLRDEHVLSTHEHLKERGVAIIVTTARPPVMDDQLPSMVGIPNLLDLRHPEDPERMHYDLITDHIRKRLLQTDDKDLLEESSRKISTMEKRSRVSLTSQPRLQTSFVKILRDRKNVFHNGYCFVDHDKGPSVIEMFSQLEWKPLHTIIIDDSTRAMGSYIRTILQKQFPGTVHLLFYPPAKH